MYMPPPYVWLYHPVLLNDRNQLVAYIVPTEMSGVPVKPLALAAFPEQLPDEVA
jgi:hypothetical protein